jgi:cyclopropane-fatty-acyl-phospholipid synthase
VNTTTAHIELAEPKNTSLVSFLRRRLLQRLSGLRFGELVLRDAFGVQHLGAPSPDGLCVEVTVIDTEAFYFSVASQGSVGVCGSYGDGAWRADDLVGLVRLFVRNTDVLDGVEASPLARVGGVLLDRFHARNRNTRAGSRKNIAAHYDLGNDLFRLFLDDSMMYSSAIYVDDNDTLEVAQARRLQRVCDKLDLGPDDHLLEIGTGWGGMAIYAARHYGCRVTTTTISEAQRELAVERITAAGLADRVTVLSKDYRDLSGTYDKLVSLEMIEAVGADFLDAYFAKVASLLTHDGLALVQAITIEDSRYESALHSVDFIKRYIFPGSFIPSVSVMLSSSAQHSDLRVTSLEDIGPSYARTLAAWRQRFTRHEPEVRALGYDDRFIRLWTLYLAYCEGGFEERRLSNVQLLLAKPGDRSASWLPNRARGHA